MQTSMQNIHVLEVKPLVQKFFKPNSTDFIFFLDDGVVCPSNNNPYKTDKGNIPVSALCFDCKSFKGFFAYDEKKSIFCEGEFELVFTARPTLRDYLEPIEQTPDLFWAK